MALRARYRRNFWRPWFYVEFWPSIGWADERDWEMLFGGRVRVEINLGSQGELRLDE